MPRPWRHADQDMPERLMARRSTRQPTRNGAYRLPTTPRTESMSLAES